MLGRNKKKKKLKRYNKTLTNLNYYDIIMATLIHLLGKSYSLSLCHFLYVFQGRILDLIVPAPDHCYVPNFENVGDILVSACPCVCTYVWRFEISS